MFVNSSVRMLANRALYFLPLLFVVLSLMTSCSREKPMSSGFLVGVASATVNPGNENFIAGDKKNRRFAGIHDSLYVKAIAITERERSSEAEGTIVLLTVDCIGLIYPTLLEIRQAVAQRIPKDVLDPSHIVVSSTHTHSGPDVVGLWGEDQMSSGVQDAYMEQLVILSANAIEEAIKNRQPATASYAETTFGEDWVYNISKSEELDRSLTILQFKDLEGKSIATLSNFACHPTFMDGVTDQASADYLGGFYRELDAELHGMNLFLQGSIGGWVQPEHEEKTFENAMRRGRELAREVMNSLETSKTMDSTGVQYRSRVFSLPVSNQGFQQLSSLGVIKRQVTDSVQTEIAWFEIGSAQFVTHPGETSPIYSLESKDLMNTSGPKFILGLGMDGLGYILTPDFFDSANHIPHSEYLTGMSIDKNAGAMIMEVIEELTGNQ